MNGPLGPIPQRHRRTRVTAHVSERFIHEACTAFACSEISFPSQIPPSPSDFFFNLCYLRVEHRMLETPFGLS